MAVDSWVFPRFLVFTEFFIRFQPLACHEACQNGGTISNRTGSIRIDEAHPCQRHRE